MRVKVFNKLERADYNNKRGENGYFRKTYYFPSDISYRPSFLVNLDILFECSLIRRQDADVVGIAFNDNAYVDGKGIPYIVSERWCPVEVDDGGMYFYRIPDYAYKIYIYFREKSYKGD